MKTYLITGGAGFIGSNFIIYMLNKYTDIKIINLDKLTYAGNLENLKSIEEDKRYTFVKGDICDRHLVSSLFKKYEIDYVVNFAAESHVDRSIENPDIFVHTNIIGTNNLLECAKNEWEVDGVWRSGVKFLQISTDEVYGSLGEYGYFTEQTPIDPHSPYSASKGGSDLIVKSYHDTYKMPINITRCSNNYGPYQFPEKLIPLLINNCLNNKPLPIYGDGLNIRDWLFVEDHCKAIDIVINDGRDGEVYNIGGHNERTNIDIVKTVINYLNENVDSKITESLIRYVEDRKGHDRRYGIDPTKIQNELRWYPQIDFEEGIKKTIKWYLDNKQWIDNIATEKYTQYYENMNILLTSVGRRGYLVKYFKEALNNKGEIHIANNTPITPAFNYTENTVITPLIYDEEYIPFIKNYCTTNNINAIISLFDIDLPILSKHKREFEEMGIKILVSDEEVIKVCNDKWETYKFMKSNNIKTPRTFLSYEEACEAINNKEINYPLIIKPRWGMGSISVEEVSNLDELRVLYNKVKNNILKTYLKYESVQNIEQCVLIQEKIIGQEHGLDVINDLCGNYKNTIVKKKYAMRSGETDCAEIVYDEKLINLGEQLSCTLRHIANLDVDVFVTENEVYVLEMNARFGGGYPFSHIAGVNLPKAIVGWLENEYVDEKLLSAKIGTIAHKDINIVELNNCI